MCVVLIMQTIQSSYTLALNLGLAQAQQIPNCKLYVANIIV